MKKLFLTIIASVFALNTINAQEVTIDQKTDRFEFNAGLETSHLWRGLIISDKPTVTGMIKMNLDNQNKFHLGLWGGTAISNESDGTHYKEINYFIEYVDTNFSIGLWDLFNTRGIDNPEVFNYEEDETTHILDLRTTYYFGDAFPMSLQANVLLYGTADREYDENGKDSQKYSTYVEAAYPVYKGNVDVGAFIGAGFALDGDTHLYGDQEHSFDIVNVGLNASKDINIGNFSLPVNGMVFWNPSNEYVRMQISTSLF
ncbi:hypothetical protein GO491_01575 [Flavobacteriaceae bacterium Ap0902]|nr:hypothetical protein [Flavobacteriaceae bacterium Ap0902]